MVFKDFIIKKRTFRRRKLSTIQHKLRVLMKCYTIVGFDIDEEEHTFTFKKTHKINGLKMNDSKEYSGRYEVEDIGDENVNLRLIVGENKKEEDADE
jgi:hypothetical protein